MPDSSDSHVQSRLSVARTRMMLLATRSTSVSALAHAELDYEVCAMVDPIAPTVGEILRACAKLDVNPWALLKRHAPAD